MTFDTLIMIRINADVLFCFGFGKWILTDVQRSEFMVTLKVWPPPNTAVNNMWLSFTVTDLPECMCVIAYNSLYLNVDELPEFGHRLNVQL